ncbi:MAG: hypothetical protein V7749_00970 [Cocleimonas sp.]
MSNNTEIWIIDTKAGKLTFFLLMMIFGLFSYEIIGSDKSEAEFLLGVPFKATHTVSGLTEILTEKGTFVVDSPISLLYDKRLSLKTETYTSPIFAHKRTKHYICQQDNCIEIEGVLLSKLEG